MILLATYGPSQGVSKNVSRVTVVLNLIEYLRRAENLQDHILEMRKTRMAEVNRKNCMSMMS